MKREKLQSFRQSKHLTQEQMANVLDITVSHYKAIEYGQRNPSFELMERIKNVFPKANIDKIFLS
ncbi:MAG: helix-turn-helix transcriptional regulator [Clostridia bacterium]|jgi:putative transcriptional regulator